MDTRRGCVRIGGVEAERVGRGRRVAGFESFLGVFVVFELEVRFSGFGEGCLLGSGVEYVLF